MHSLPLAYSLTPVGVTLTLGPHLRDVRYNYQSANEVTLVSSLGHFNSLCPQDYLQAAERERDLSGTTI